MPGLPFGVESALFYCIKARSLTARSERRQPQGHRAMVEVHSNALPLLKRERYGGISKGMPITAGTPCRHIDPSFLGAYNRPLIHLFKESNGYRQH
jgi:hypothetical protein